ncbi:hypothetical protein LCGC14_2457890 [marine sediment metagenome]|uniref:Uncharacterized protein n=1 Tax=marine sediment metagenome TaxID=412755 RepID=A0A0F9DRC6_9ZZZZ
MHIVTQSISKDEPCHGLYDGPRNIPRKGHRWVQAVYVIRDDAIAEYLEDIGPASDYARIQPMMIPSFGENTVAQLQEFALKNRHDEYWAKRVDEMLAESTLIEDHLRQFEVDREVIRNRSHFGPGIAAQRNGYPRKAAREHGRST